MRVLLVTGASSGTGRAIVIECARAFPDARFVLTARREDELQVTAELAGLTSSRVELVALDIASPDAPDALAGRARARFGRLDVLVNNAGIGSDVEFEDERGTDAARRVVDVNLVAPMALTRACLDLLDATDGSIVNISSVAGLVGTANAPVYSATKWALTGFSDALRARVASRGIHVAAIHPGPVPTPGWPHERLTRTRWAAPLHCEPSAIGRAVVSAVRTRRAMFVRPRIYAVVPFLRILAPGLTRSLTRAMADRSDRSAP